MYIVQLPTHQPHLEVISQNKVQYLLLKSARFVTNHKFQSLMFDMKLMCMGTISFYTVTGDPSLAESIAVGHWNTFQTSCDINSIFCKNKG